MASSQMHIIPFYSQCFPTTEQVNKKILIRLLQLMTLDALSETVVDHQIEPASDPISFALYED